jgi:nucleolar protein 6
MSTSQKLTKKQKKSLAFRERKQSKSRSFRAGHGLEVENSGLPVMEVQDLAGLQSGGLEGQELEERSTGAGKRVDAEERKKGGKVDRKSDRQHPKDVVGTAAKESKKRKREEAQEVCAAVRRPKRKKSEAVAESREDEDAEAGEKKPLKGEAKQRFILFLGMSLASSPFFFHVDHGTQVISNTPLLARLSWNTLLPVVSKNPFFLRKESHSANCYPDPSPTVRLLTPRSQKPVNKSKGCAFLEFTHRNALQQALKLHHSELDGRKINVELTAGGGGKSTTRITKVQQRNKELHDQRVSLPLTRLPLSNT